MTQRTLVLGAWVALACGGAYAQATGSTAADGTVIVQEPPAAAVVVPSSPPATAYYYTNEPGNVPQSRAQVQAEGSAAMHSGGLARGEALATRNRPHGGAMNADAPSTGAGAGHTNGINGWSNGPSGDGG
jgi:hypothetical protein